jgi:hypothetical protein
MDIKDKSGQLLVSTPTKTPEVANVTEPRPKAGRPTGGPVQADLSAADDIA